MKKPLLRVILQKRRAAGIPSRSGQRISRPGEAGRKWRPGALAFILLLGWGVLGGTPVPVERSAIEKEIQSTDVEFRNGTTVLRGTILHPEAAGPGPGIVILGGAERGARNDYKKRVASKFAEIGISALYYDSPGSGASTGNALLQTKDDRIIEALAAVEFLGRREGIHPHKIGLWGISEGANIALLAAAREPRVSFVVSVSAALGIAPLEISRFRIEITGHENRISAEDIARALVLEEILYDLFSGADLAEWRLIELKVLNWPDEPWPELIEAVKASRRAAPPAERRKAKEALTRSLGFWREKSWFRLAVPDVDRLDRLAALDAGSFLSFLDGNPLAQGDWLDHLRALPELSKLRCPVLALWGENDRFLPPHRSAAVLKRLLQEGKTALTTAIIPGVGHILTSSGNVDIASDYSKILADWTAAKIR